MGQTHEQMVKAGQGPLPSVQVEGTDIVIRLPVSYLPCAVENAGDAGSLDVSVELEDAESLTIGIVELLSEEEEDGTTPVHTLLDQVLAELARRVRARGHNYGHGLRILFRRL